MRITAVLLCSAIALFSWFAYPVPGWDAVYFVVPAIRYAGGHGLTSPLYSFDATGYGRWVQYPPLFELVLGWIMPRPAPRWALVSIGMMNCVSLLMFAAILTKILVWLRGPRIRQLTGLATITLIGATGASRLAGNDGRPEALATPLLLSGGLLMVCGIWNPWMLGGLVGLIAVTQPVESFMAAALLAACFGIQWEPRIAWIKLAKACLSATFAGAFILMVSPIPFAALAAGLRLHVPAAFGSSAGSPVLSVIRSRLHSWQLMPDEALLVLLVAGPIYCVRRKSLTVRTFPLFWAGLIGFSITALYILLEFPNRDYYFPPVLPVSFIALLFCAASLPSPTFSRNLAAIVLIAFAPAFMFSRDLVLFPVFLKKGVSLNEARARFAKIVRANEGEPVGVSAAMWALSEHYERMYLPANSHSSLEQLYSNGPTENRPDIQRSIFIQQQNNFPLHSPPEIPGCRLLADDFEGGSATLAGVQLAHNIPGYSFAAYQCSHVPPKTGRETPEFQRDAATRHVRDF